jgi:hypothetical protein
VTLLGDQVEPVEVLAVSRRRLPILSNSEMRTFRRCIVEHDIAYRRKVRPRLRAEALRFGTLVHAGLEAWWSTVSRGAALEALRRSESDPFELVKAEALMIGYHARWEGEPLAVLAVEAQFECDLVNPKTGKASKTFRLGGKLDAIAQRDDGVWIVEHKTTSEDVDAGSPYWQRLRLDSQVSTYYRGAQSLGYDVRGCIYDVIRKPSLKPYKATPIEDRKYTAEKSRACAECKKKNPAPGPHVEDGVACVDGRVVTDPGGRLYATMRDRDETPDEYRARLLEDIAEKPERYYVRGEVVRTAEDETAGAADAWMIAQSIREAERLGRYPRNVDACVRYGRTCDYFDACTGTASLADPLRYRVADRAHEELEVMKP